MKIFTTFLKKIAPALIAISLAIVLPHMALAASPDESLCKGSGGTYTNGMCINNPDSFNSQPTVMETIKNVTNILLILAGSIAVIMIIIGGIRYATSNGEQAQVTGAKNTILYAIIGVVVTILAYAVVNFVTTFIK